MPDINYFVCVGGTGSQIGESFVYLAACGYLGEGKTKIWIVDKDTRCASGVALSKAVNEYQSFQRDCRKKDAAWFAHQLELYTWNFDGALAYVDPAANGDSAFSALGNADSATQMMMHFLHDTESLNNSMSKGFYGRAQTGTALYKAIERSTYLSRDALFADIRNEITLGNRPCVYFAGSSFGATGASLLPNMAKSLRTTFANAVVIGGVLMLPYYTYPDKSKDGSKPLVSPDTHWNKSKEALRYYGSADHMTIRNVGDALGGKAVFDSFYIAGSTPRIYTNSRFADGGEAQDNNRHIAELYAAMGAKHFFGLCKGEQEKNGVGKPAVHAYALGTPLDTPSAGLLNWGDLDPDLMLPMLSLARFSLAMLTCLYPMTHPKGDLRQDDTMKRCFGADGILGRGPAHIDVFTAQSSTKCAAEFSKIFLDYLFQINAPQLVGLFEQHFLPLVQKNLITYPRAKQTVSRFRDFALPEAYSTQDRGSIQQSCQLKRIRSDLAKVHDMTTYANNLREHVINQMRGTVASKRPAAEAYPQHTADGMKELYQAAFDYCNSLGGY